MNRIEIKENNLSIDRIEEKCINCGMCKKTCEANNNIGDECINCGACILTCPSGALVPKFNYRKVLNYINDTDYTVVAFVSPAVRVAIGDEFGYEPGTFLESKLASAIKAIGFDYCFDTNFGADLTVMEEASELITRINNKKTPMFTSCCPSWVNFIDKFHPEDKELLSTCKSPISMQSAMIKNYFASMYELNPRKIIAVAIAPCVSKKSEIKIYPDTDISITTRELAIMLRELNVDFNNLSDEKFDRLLSEYSGAGLMFGVSGGVAQATIRTAYYMINKEEPPADFFKIEQLQGEKDIKTAVINMKKFDLHVAVVSKISTVKENYDTLKEYDFIEVMACPGGCIGGAGQPLVAIKDLKEIRQKRMESIYKKDEECLIKSSYQNQEIRDAYISYINKNKVVLHTNEDINTLQSDKLEV